MIAYVLLKYVSSKNRPKSRLVGACIYDVEKDTALANVGMTPEEAKEYLTAIKKLGNLEGKEDKGALVFHKNDSMIIIEIKPIIPEQ